MTITSHHLRTMLEHRPTKHRVHPLEFIARSSFYFALGFCLAITISEAFKPNRQTADKFRPPTILQSTNHQCPAHFWTDHLKKGGR